MGRAGGRDTSESHRVTTVGADSASIRGRFICALLTSLLVVQATTNAITPLLSLLVGQLAPQATAQTIVLMTESAAAPGLATILMAGRVGRILDRLGAGRCLIIFLILAIVDLLLTSLVHQVALLVGLRLILGLRMRPYCRHFK